MTHLTKNFWAVGVRKEVFCNVYQSEEFDAAKLVELGIIKNEEDFTIRDTGGVNLERSNSLERRQIAPFKIKLEALRAATPDYVKQEVTFPSL